MTIGARTTFAVRPQSRATVPGIGIGNARNRTEPTSSSNEHPPAVEELRRRTAAISNAENTVDGLCGPGAHQGCGRPLQFTPLTAVERPSQYPNMKRSNGYRSSDPDAKHRTTPALGVVLMVSVTLLFVAVLGAFSFGLSLESLTTPQVTLSTAIDVPDDQIKISHMGGDSLAADRTSIVVVNESDGQRIVFAPTRNAGPFEVGQTVVISTSSASIDGWELEPGDRTFELRRGMAYTIKVVDSDSNNVLYRTTLTTA